MSHKDKYFKKRTKWNEQTDFNGISVIGFLCDNDQIIRGNVIRQKQGNIFVHFDQAASHYGKKYDWIVVPNKRICYPPNKQPPHVPLPILIKQDESTEMKENDSDFDCKSIKNGCKATHRMINALIYYS
eukprot:149687_1